MSDFCSLFSKTFTCHRFSFMDGELHKESIFFVTLSCLQRTRCQQKVQHEIVIWAFVLDGLVLLTKVKIVGRTMLLSIYLCGYLQRVAEMVRNLVELFFCKKKYLLVGASSMLWTGQWISQWVSEWEMYVCHTSQIGCTINSQSNFFS